MNFYHGCGPIPPQVLALLPNAEEIAQACARTVFAHEWGNAIERAEEARRYPESEESARGAAPEGFEIPNLSGVDLREAAPHDEAPGRFLQFARDVVAQSVALAFADPRGMETLERWAEDSAEELGHQFALEALGTGAAEFEEDSDSELVPTCDCDGRLHLELSEVWEPDELSDAELRKLTKRPGELLSDEELASLREALDSYRGFEALDEASDILRGFGVESVALPDEDSTCLHYVNMGDTYALTLTHDGKRFRVEDWGGALERAEEARTLETGETRCAYCGAWGELLGGKPCADCGHVAD